MKREAIIKHLYISISLGNQNKFEQLLKKITDQFNEISSFELETIYVGGNGLTVLNTSQLTELLNLIAKLSKDHSVKEYSFEVPIEKTILSKLTLLKQYRVNRLSFKVISFNDQLLKQMGFLYRKEDIVKIYKTSLQLGFNNINFDMTYNLLKQSKKQFVNDCKMIKKLNPKHVCWYEKEIDTKNDLKQLEKLKNKDFYFMVNKVMHKQKYFRYELTSFLKEEKYCEHSLAWWTNQLYYGIGSDAYGCIYENNNYYLINSGEDNNLSAVTKTLLSQKDYYFQIIMMGLHLDQGICFATVTDGKNACLFYQYQINKLINKGLLILTDLSLRLSELGKSFFNNVLLFLLDE